MLLNIREHYFKRTIGSKGRSIFICAGKWIFIGSPLPTPHLTLEEIIFFENIVLYSDSRIMETHKTVSLAFENIHPIGDFPRE